MIGLYVHIPFCVSKCIYCDFKSYVANNFHEYAQAVKKELSLYANKLGRITIDTVFFGGGTPTVMPASDLTSILDCIRQCFVLSPEAEISIEVNPNSCQKDKAQSLIQHGFNRFSVGLQCPNDRILRLLNRPHNTLDFCHTIEILRECGATNVSADVILGLPQQTYADLDKTLELVAKYNLQHLSAYGLSVERGTPLYRKVKDGSIVLPDDDLTADYYDYVVKGLAQLGLDRYEISNFARKGYQCKHNSIYWNSQEYLGVGTAAVGRIGDTRYCNAKTIDLYLNKLKQGLPVTTRTHLSKEDKMYEFVMLGLRLSQGVSLSRFQNLFGIGFFDYYKDKVTQLIDSGALQLIDGDRLRISDKFVYVGSQVLLKLL